MIAVPRKNVLTGRGLPPSRDSHETNDPSVRPAANHGELSEVFVESYEYAFFCVRRGEESLIARVLWPVACPDHVMAEGDESVFRTSPDAGVEEKLHSASEVTSGSIRSWATSLWA